MEVSYKTIGQNIRRARLKIGLTQEKASQQLGVSTMHWGRIERGERPIKLDRLCSIANVLHVKLSTLLSGCVLDDDFDESAEIEDIVFGQMMIQIAKKCSPTITEVPYAIGYFSDLLILRNYRFFRR